MTEYYKRELEMNPYQPRLSSNSGDSMTPRLLLNSTKPKDYAKNGREEMRGGVCVCVLFSTPSLVFIGGNHRPQHPKPT